MLARGLFSPRLKEGPEYPSWDSRREARTGSAFAGARRAHSDLRRIAEEQGMSVAQLAIAWVLSHPGVTCAVIGASTPEQAEHDLAASGRRLEPALLEECEKIAKAGCR